MQTGSRRVQWCGGGGGLNAERDRRTVTWIRRENQRQPIQSNTARRHRRNALRSPCERANARDDGAGHRQAETDAEGDDDRIRLGIVSVLGGVIPLVDGFHQRTTEADEDDRHDRKASSSHDLASLALSAVGMMMQRAQLMRLWLIRHRLRVIVHRIRFPGRPMFTSAAGNELLGKTVIVGLERMDADGCLVGRDQYYGTIAEASRTGGVKVQTSSGEVITLPPDLRPYFGAPSGANRSNSTSDAAADPDLQTTWTQTLPPD